MKHTAELQTIIVDKQTYSFQLFFRFMSITSGWTEKRINVSHSLAMKITMSDNTPEEIAFAQTTEQQILGKLAQEHDRISRISFALYLKFVEHEQRIREEDDLESIMSMDIQRINYS